MDIVETIKTDELLDVMFHQVHSMTCNDLRLTNERFSINLIPINETSELSKINQINRYKYIKKFPLSCDRSVH